jgi:hypothetical protein
MAIQLGPIPNNSMPGNRVGSSIEQIKAEPTVTTQFWSWRIQGGKKCLSFKAFVLPILFPLVFAGAAGVA